MSENKMLIDAAHPEETRVVVLRAGRVEEFDYESAARKQLRGNIYLAKVTRVEPALQAAFIDYGGNRHGFLAFNEVHPDYYQIPMADRLALLEEEAAAEAQEEEEIDLAAESDSEAGEDACESDDDDDDDLDEADDDLVDGPFDVHASEDDDDLDDEDGEASSAGAATEGKTEAVGNEAQDIAAAVPDAPEQAGGNASPAASGEPADSGDTLSGDDTSGVDEPGTVETERDDRPTVLSQAMPADETLSEIAPEAAPTISETSADPDAAIETVAVTLETTVVSVQSGESAEEGDTLPGSEAFDEFSNEEPVGSTLDDDQPDYYTPSEAGAEASADDDTDSDDDTEQSSRTRGRRSGRPASGRRRRGGRSRRGRSRDNESSTDESGEGVEQVGNEDALEELPSRPRRTRRSYKIQEVVKRRQVLLIQVVKEERGNKGAALTTYLSLAGRYTVLMPNTARGGGISRKITNPQDRKRLKAIANELDVPQGMGLIIRTAGAARTKQEIRRDFEYLLRLWESVRELTLESTAPALVYEEGDLIKRSIRDLYNKDVDQVVVAGDDAYRSAKDFMRMLMPSHAKNVVQYQDPEPLFTGHGIERQLNAMFSPYVHLPSGGYLVINQTEALVAIDVNSGRSTREFSIEETALNTNLEASDEIARQLKLRDLAGLIVIDYIDMEERRNNRNVERRIREALKDDRARIQIGRISPFGLLEMSRQRLRTGVLEGSTSQCAHCQGTGIIRSVESVALGVLRGLEDAVMAGARTSLIANTTSEVALYILNNKREFVIAMEQRLGMPVVIQASAKMAGANFTIEKGEAVAPVARAAPKTDAVSVDWGFDGDEQSDSGEAASSEPDSGEQRARNEESGEERSRPRRRRRRRGGRRSDDETARDSSDSSDSGDEADDGDQAENDTLEARRDDDDQGEEKSGRRRRRGRRGGRRNRGRNRDGENNASANEDNADADGDGDGDGNGNGENAQDNGEDSGNRDRFTQRSAGDRKAANDDEPDPDKSSEPVEPTSPLVTRIKIGASSDSESAGPTEPETVSETASVEEISADGADTEEKAAQVALSEQAVAAVEVGASESETEAESPPRRNRGEPVSSEPRVARITVSPDGPATDTPNTSSDSEASTQSDEKPTRRGWWQRKLLGDG